MNLKVKDNLFIIDNRVISYETEVAQIKGDEIVMNGKYSRTTGQQMSYLAGLTGLKLVRSDKSVRYLKFYNGVKCRVRSQINISVAGAKKILGKLQFTQDLEKAAVLAYKELWAVDRAFIKMELGAKGWDEREMLALSDAHHSLGELGII